MTDLIFFSFTISVPGFGDTLITIEMICDCECSKTRDENSTKCTGHGAYTCTSCECNEGRKGDKCQCDEIENADNSACKVSNETDQICSGLGECVCGVCQCTIREVRCTISHNILFKKTTNITFSATLAPTCFYLSFIYYFSVQ